MFNTCAGPDLVVQLIATPKADLDHYLVVNHEVVLQEEGTLCYHSLFPVYCYMGQLEFPFSKFLKPRITMINLRVSKPLFFPMGVCPQTSSSCCVIIYMCYACSLGKRFSSPQKKNEGKLINVY